MTEPAGTVLVSSNIIPVLWRVDPATGRAEQVPILLLEHATRDIGFSALELTAPSALNATSAIDGTPWRIDLRTRTATSRR